jgi:hypothetical protein
VGPNCLQKKLIEILSLNALRGAAKLILFPLDQGLTTERFHRVSDGNPSNSDLHHPWCINQYKAILGA